jgi:hypothetical protein
VVRGGLDPRTNDLDFLVEMDALRPARYAAANFDVKG